MEINKAKFERVVEEAKAKTNDRRWLNAIEKAAKAILSGEMIVTTLAHGALVTTANGTYAANGHCNCESASKNVQASAPADTRISSPVKARKQKAKPKSEGKPKKARLPKEKRRARPPSVTSYTWRKDGAGWELRKSVYVVTDTGIRKRRLPYVAHLSKSAFGELKRKHKGAALERAIAEWIEDHDQ